jgi:CMP-N,N'-diacetyllegionaminic acid synthase
MKIAALVPVRKGSTRIPNKNLALLGEETLLGRKIRQLKHSDVLTHIYVGTDGDELANEADKHGVEVVYRDPVCCDESQASANMMIADFVKRVSCDIVVWVHVTNPFVDTATYDNAVLKYLDQQAKGFDSLISVLPVQEHLWTPNYYPLNYNPYKERHTLAKELPAYFRQTGAFFIQHHAAMKNNSYFFGKRPYLYKTTELEAIDINTPFDLSLSRIVCSQLNQL